MNIIGGSRQHRDWWAGVVWSVAVHAIVIALMVVVYSHDRDEPEEAEQSVEVVLDDEERPEPDPPMPPTDEPPPQPAVPPEVVEDEPDEEEEQEDVEDEDESPDDLDDTSLDRYAVEQASDDDEEPDAADHVADEAHQTDEETVAETTTLEDVEPPEDPEAIEQEADTDRELAMQLPDHEVEPSEVVDIEEIEDVDDPEEEEEPDEVEEIDDTDEVDAEQPDEAERDELPEKAVSEREYRDPQEMVLDPDGDQPAPEQRLEAEDVFRLDPSKAEGIIDEDAVAQAERPRHGRRLLANWRENEEAMRAALENYLPHVEPGNHTSVNARAAPHASYIARMHRSIHPKWAGSFIPRVSRNFSSTDPINDMGRVVVVEIVIDADSGEVVETGPVRPSGHEMFDAEAMNIARSIGDQPDPPEAIVSPDGNVYIHWSFWRDQRRCGTFGASIYRVQEPGERREIDGL